MGVSTKHMATFLLGAAAGFAAFKYMNLTAEEKEKLHADLKEKAGRLKEETESIMEKGKDFFEELRTKGSSVLKEHFSDAERMLKDLFSSEKAG